MWIKRTANSAETILMSISRVMNIVGMTILAIIMLLTVLDVFLRYVFRRPILGSTEITEYLMVCLALGMAWCLLRGRSIKMDLVVQRFSPRVQAVIDSITYVISLGVLATMTWRTLTETITMQRALATSYILKIPSSPFYGLLTLALALFCLAMLVNLVKSIARAAKK